MFIITGILCTSNHYSYITNNRASKRMHKLSVRVTAGKEKFITHGLITPFLYFLIIFLSSNHSIRFFFLFNFGIINETRFFVTISVTSMVRFLLIIITILYQFLYNFRPYLHTTYLITSV